MNESESHLFWEMVSSFTDSCCAHDKSTGALFRTPWTNNLLDPFYLALYENHEMDE